MEMEKRIDWAQSQLIELFPTHKIIQNGVKQFGVTERQVANYIQRAYARWAKRKEPARNARVHAQKERLAVLARKLIKLANDNKTIKDIKFAPGLSLKTDDDGAPSAERERIEIMHDFRVPAFRELLRLESLYAKIDQTLAPIEIDHRDKTLEDLLQETVNHEKPK